MRQRPIIPVVMWLASALVLAGGQQPNPDRALPVSASKTAQQPNPDRYASSASEATAANPLPDIQQLKIIDAAADQLCGHTEAGSAQSGLTASQKETVTALFKRLSTVAAAHSGADRQALLEKDLGAYVTSSAQCKMAVINRLLDFAFPRPPVPVGMPPRTTSSASVSQSAGERPHKFPPTRPQAPSPLPSATSGASGGASASQPAKPR
jgi:hypothetical protein